MTLPPSAQPGTSAFGPLNNHSVEQAPAMSGPEPSFKERVEALKEVTNLFRFERTVYLVLTASAVVLLLVSATVLIVKEGPDLALLTPLFGSTGLIAFTVGRVLRMWDRALDILQPPAVKK